MKDVMGYEKVISIVISIIFLRNSGLESCLARAHQLASQIKQNLLCLHHKQFISCIFSYCLGHWLKQQQNYSFQQLFYEKIVTDQAWTYFYF